MDNAAERVVPQKMHVSFMEPCTRDRSWNEEERCEIDEMRAARQEQDHLITRLTEDNIHLESTVAALESTICKLQARLRWSGQGPLGRSLPELETVHEDSPGDVLQEESTEDRDENEYDDPAEYIEAAVLRQHAHCTPDQCWRQKYTESLGQLRAVLEQLKNELEQKAHPEEFAENLAANRQSKVQLIEESIRTIDVVNKETSNERANRRSRKRSILGWDSSLRRVKLSRTSDSQVSISKTPLFKRMMNLFKKKSSGDGQSLDSTTVSAK